MATQDPVFDPYFRTTSTGYTQYVQSARPIVLTQNSGDLDDVVSVVSRDRLIVYGDQVTIRGKITVRQPPPTQMGGVVSGKVVEIKPDPRTSWGGDIVIVARCLDTLTDEQTGDAVLDLEGDTGVTSTEYWTGPPHQGVGDRGAPGSGETPGGTGQSSADASGIVDPKSPLNGGTGADGGLGGRGGKFVLICGSLAPTVALDVDVSGGHGGDGLDGQPGAKGGPGGGGDQSAGGDGGRGGNGGDGGRPGLFGGPGWISIWLLNGSATPAITCTLNAGEPGHPGQGGAAGGCGDPGPGGIQILPPSDSSGLGSSVTFPDGNPGAPGTAGKTPAKLMQGAAHTAAIVTPFTSDTVATQLRQLPAMVAPLTAQLAMMLDRLEADYLLMTGKDLSDPSATEGLTDGLNWVTTLAKAYTAFGSPADETALDAVRARIKVMHKHLKNGLDYFGNGPTFAPLGSLQFYSDALENTLKDLTALQKKYENNLAVLDSETATAQQLQKAEADVKASQQGYLDGTVNERKTIVDLIARISGPDSAAISALTEPFTKGAEEFEAAVSSACGGLKLADLIDVVGQFAFFSEFSFQRSAMLLSQGAKLLDAATSKILEDDGTRVDKKWVIDQLTTVTDLTASLKGYSGTKTIAGVKLSDDPAAVKLIGKQTDLDNLCSKFWSYPEARKFKGAFDAYVSAVQARNADILALNSSLAKLHGYLAGAGQAAASLAQASWARGRAADPGRHALVTQLSRMVRHATDDCINQLYLVSRAYWMWSLQAGDELASHLQEIGSGYPLAVTPDVLRSAREGIASDYTTFVTEQLKDPGGWFPPPVHDGVWYPVHGARGVPVTFTHDTHPTLIESLRTAGTAQVAILAPRRDTPVGDSPFSGYGDVRITKVRPWVFGARFASATPKKNTIYVRLTHTGTETIVLPDDTAALVSHDPVEMPFEYAVNKPDDPSGIMDDSDLFDPTTPSPSPAPSAMVGPFTTWQVDIPTGYNDPSLDISGIDKVVFEFFGHRRPFLP